MLIDAGLGLIVGIIVSLTGRRWDSRGAVTDISRAAHSAPGGANRVAGCRRGGSPQARAPMIAGSAYCSHSFCFSLPTGRCAARASIMQTPITLMRPSPRACATPPADASSGRRAARALGASSMVAGLLSVLLGVGGGFARWCRRYRAISIRTCARSRHFAAINWTMSAAILPANGGEPAGLTVENALRPPAACMTTLPAAPPSEFRCEP